MSSFNEAQFQRYSRQLILREVGGEGQRKLQQAKVLVIGAGGLGSAAAFYLAAAGVGRLGIVDPDAVELSNLQRQILHATADLGKPKVDSARRALTALNPDTEVMPHPVRLNPENIAEVIAAYDLAIDGTDNFPARYLINDACVLARKPLSHGSVLGFEGQAMTILPGQGPCYRCLYEQSPPPGLAPSCQEAGVLGAVPGVIGLVQATEAIKWILGKGKLLVGRLLLYNALEMEFRQVKVRRRADCPVCGEHPIITELTDYEQCCSTRPRSC